MIKTKNISYVQKMQQLFGTNKFTVTIQSLDYQVFLVLHKKSDSFSKISLFSSSVPFSLTDRSSPSISLFDAPQRTACPTVSGKIALTHLGLFQINFFYRQTIQKSSWFEVYKLRGLCPFTRCCTEQALHFSIQKHNPFTLTNKNVILLR